MKLANIYSVALYESKTLFRSWFFRIFSILALLMLFGTNMGLFGGHSDAPWTFRAIQANLPYMNVLIINVAQAIIAVFLASDFLKRDKKLDTTEVIYARPITNGEYVVGKTSGILVLFVGLVLTTLVMVLVFNLVRQDTPVAWEAYLYYPLLITLPTLVYILGLSFFLMILFRSQAVTFLVLLAYIFLTLIYFQDKVYGLLDYMVFNLPMVYSDFIGFANPQRILLHRLAYFLMGSGFIFATIRFLNRLPQTGRWNFLNLLLFLVFMAGGLGAAYMYYQDYRDEDHRRESYVELNNRHARRAVPDVLSNRMKVTQEGNGLRVSSSLRFRNPGGEPMDSLLFSLNPGFRIDSLLTAGEPVNYLREEQLLWVLPEEPLGPYARGSFQVHYSGKADGALAYLDIPREEANELKKAAMATFDKEGGILHQRYMLLTPELNWYPRAGVGFNLENFLPAKPDFVRFSLEVQADSGLTAIAPGRIDTLDASLRFVPEQDLNALALVLAPLERRSLEVEGIQYNLYLHEGHDYFSGYFSEIGDTLGLLLREAQDNYEIDELDLYYPFQRINLIEVPIQFHAYERPYIEGIETILPEMILLPEKGAGLNTMDFKRFLTVEERQDKDRESERSTREIQVDQFKRFLQNTFFRTSNRTTGLRGRGDGGERIITYNENLYSQNPYCVFPLYYTHMTTVSSQEYPVFNAMLEQYLKEGFEVSPREGFQGGISDKERANLALRDESLVELFARWDTELTSSLINQTGSHVFAALKNKVGMADFDNFLYYYLEDHAFREIHFDELARDFFVEFGVEMAPYLDIIRSEGGMASLLISEPEYLQTRDDIGDVYLIRYQISNVGTSLGLVEMNYRVMGSGGFGMGQGPEEELRVHEIGPGESRDIQVVLYERPMMLTINTLISGNIPSSWNVFLRGAREVEKAEVEPYNRLIDPQLSPELEEEVVVDNEDPGFSQFSISRASKVKQYIEARKEEEEGLKYQQLNRWWSPYRWTPVAHSAYYGETVRSAMVIRKGEGTNTASWTCELPDAGFYELYAYIPVGAMMQFNRGGGDQQREGGPGAGPGGGRGRPEFADKGTEYHYRLESSEGTEEVVLELNQPEQGWNLLGVYRLPADSVKVSLSDAGKGRRVIADAIKFVKN